MVAIIVEDGSVVSGANSYVSVAEADDYLSVNPYVYPTWSALTADDQANLLIFSTRYIDQRAIWNGYRTDEDSPLRWPRTGVYDADGNAIGANEIPDQLKQAVIEMARYLMLSDRAIERSSDGISMVKVDVITVQFDTSYSLSEIPNELAYILTNLGVLNTGGGVAFKRIRKT